MSIKPAPPAAGVANTVTLQTEHGAGSRQAGAAGAEPTDAKPQFDRAILDASLRASLTAGNQPLALLYASAVEHLNEALAPELGDRAIQRAYDSGIDVSPHATAGRIVGLSTAFFGAYRELHPEMDLETTLDAFTKLIGSGIDRGFAEARDVLDGLEVLNGDIAANIDQTYALVQQGLKDFVANYPRPAQQS